MLGAEGHITIKMEKVPVDTTELVDYNEEEDAQLAVAPIQETDDAVTK